MLQTSAEKLDLVRDLAVFSGVGEASLLKLVENALVLEFEQGQVFGREGQIGTGLYIIVQGHVSIMRHAVKVDTAGPGEVIGELSALGQVPRVASLTATEHVVCLGVPSWALDDLLKEPGLGDRLREVARQHEVLEQRRRAAEHSGD